MIITSSTKIRELVFVYTAEPPKIIPAGTLHFIFIYIYFLYINELHFVSIIKLFTELRDLFVMIAVVETDLPSLW